jgi:opacity protein-like surface antigen
MKKVVTLCLMLVWLIDCAQAQSFYSMRRDRKLIGHIGLGTATYLGELSNEGDYFDSRPSINIGAQTFFSRRISFRTEFTWYNLKGADANADPESGRRGRNLSFQSNNYELNFTGVVSLFPNGGRFYQRPMFNVYGFAGIGVTYMNPKTVYQGEKVALQPLQTEGVSYSRIQPVIPYGLGIRIKQGAFFNIAIEGGLRKTFTDYLDDVSSVHKDVSTFSDPIAAALADRRPEVGKSLAAPGTQRGEPSSKDSYFLLNVKLEYYLPFEFGGSSYKRTSGNGNRIKYKKYKPGRRR